MAFFNSRIDIHGNEVERPFSARSIQSNGSSAYTGSATLKNISVNSSARSRNGISVKTGAIICERDGNSASRTKRTPGTSATGTSSMMVMTSIGSQQSDSGSYNDDQCMSFPSSESRSEVVPPLELEESDAGVTPRDYAYDYYKHCQEAKIERRPDVAYDTWLSAKRKLSSMDAARRKAEEERKRRDQEERRRLAEAKYEQWLAKKERARTNGKISKPAIIPNESKHQRPIRSELPPEVAQRRLEEWEYCKRIEMEHRRMLKRKEEQRQHDIEQQRIEMSKEAWEKWIANAPNKPKPVPLNRGILTLRGTISDIYINPNEWKPIIEEK